MSFIKNVMRRNLFYTCLILFAASGAVFPAYSSAASNKIHPAGAEDMSDVFMAMQKEPIGELLESADRFYELGWFEKAIVLYNRVCNEAEDPVMQKRAERTRELIGGLLMTERKEAEEMFAGGDYVPDMKRRRHLALLYKEALAYFEREDYDKAVNTFKTILSLEPNQGVARSYLRVKIPRLLKAEKIERLYQEAIGHFESKDYDKAGETLADILATDLGQEEAKDYIQGEVVRVLKERIIKRLYTQAVFLYGKDRLDEAKRLFSEILSLDPQQAEARNYIEVEIPRRIEEDGLKEQQQQQQQQRRFMEEVAALYAEALSLHGKRDYQPALEKFKEVEGLMPGYAKAVYYIERIPEDIEAQKKEAKERELREITASLYKEAQAYFESGDYDSAAYIFKEILSFDPDQRQASDYLQVKIPHALKEKKTDALYREAVSYYNDGDYDRAYDVFKDILSEDPYHREARAYLEQRIPRQIEAIKRKEIDSLYREATAYFYKKDYERAANIFKDILSEDPYHREARAYLEQRIPRQIEAIRRKEIDSLYREAAAYFYKKDYKNAMIVFKKILSIDPDQREARLYITEKIPLELTEGKEAESKEAPRVVYKKVLRKKTKKQAPPQGPSKAPSEVPLDYPSEGLIGYFYEQAFGHYKNGNLRSAQSYFKKILIVNPKENLAKTYLDKITSQLHTGN